MERSIRNCDFVIVVCTPTYAEKANSREGGVGYESMVITGALASQIESRKYIPVLRGGDWNSSLPSYLKSKHGVDLRGDPYADTEYEKLLRALYRAPPQPPPVGPKPEFVTQPSATTTIRTPIQLPVCKQAEARSNLVKWAGSYPGPCIDVTVTNSREVIKVGRAIGLEYPEPRTMKALLDTGAAVTVISRTFAKHCKLYQTGETEIRTLGKLQMCGEHAGSNQFSGYESSPH